ncbi:hypothetical protein CEP53_005187 [Fusarium sp. AF-6]|nr:hypothetical protein CEP53_005187 [Fusarium sp. AF-6]
MGIAEVQVSCPLKPDSYAFIAKLAQKYSLKAAAEVADFESANVVAMAEFIRQEKIDCDFVITRAIDVRFDEGQQRRLKEGYENLLVAGQKLHSVPRSNM